MDHSTERLDYLDVIKGIAMLLVVMQHIGAAYNYGVALICKIDVPLFFIVSGWLVGLKELNTHDIYKKFKVLIIPMAIALAFYILVHKDYTIIYTVGKGGYWFLEALFFMYILYSLCKPYKKLLLVACVYELFLLLLSKYAPESIDNIFGFSYLSRYWPAFISGALIHRLDFQKLNSLWVGTLLFALTLILFIYPSSIKNVSYLEHVIAYTTGAVFSFFLIKHYTPFMPLYLKKIFIQIGKSSLNIYILHFFIVVSLPDILANSKRFFITDFTVTTITALIICYLCIIFSKIISFKTIFSKVLR